MNEDTLWNKSGLAPVGSQLPDSRGCRGETELRGRTQFGSSGGGRGVWGGDGRYGNQNYSTGGQVLYKLEREQTPTLFWKALGFACGTGRKCSRLVIRPCVRRAFGTPNMSGAEQKLGWDSSALVSLVYQFHGARPLI